MKHFDWWFRIPSHVRYGVGLVLILISTGIYFFANHLWPWGWVIGSVMLVFGFGGGDRSAAKRGSGAGENATNQEA